VYTRAEVAGANFVSFFKKHFRVAVNSETSEALEFDVVGLDAPIANALRRILLAEVPSVALEHVFIYKNTSIIQDEVLAHRLGLVPLNVDPRMLEWPANYEDSTEANTLVFKLHKTGAAYERVDPAALDSEDDLEGRYTKVYSGDFAFDAVGHQAERFAARPPAPVEADILLAKLAPGQTIELEAHAIKGRGKVHAKWSPVATAAYRLLPAITIDEDAPFLDAEADALVARCPMNVYDIEDLEGASLFPAARVLYSAFAREKREARCCDWLALMLSRSSESRIRRLARLEWRRGRDANQFIDEDKNLYITTP
jgi:DNA-directed RNA polymerase I and III subunit RPAC1